MSRKIKIIIEDFESNVEADGAMPIKEGQATNATAIGKMVERINDELNIKLKTHIKIISNEKAN